MKEELQTKLEEHAMELLDFVDKSKDFVVEQAPIYVKELVEFHFIENAVPLGIWLVLLITAILIFIPSTYGWAKNEWDECFVTYISIASGLTIFFLFIDLTVERHENIKECYKAKYAPRVLIIEKLRGVEK